MYRSIRMAHPGDSANESGTIMYITTFDKPNDKYTVANAMAFDADDTKQSAKSAVIVVKQGEPTKLDDQAVPVQLFTPEASTAMKLLPILTRQKSSSCS